MKLSDYVIQFIAKLGVKHVFFLPGGAAMHLNDSLGRCPDMSYVCNLHEQACAIAAEAYAKVSGNFGVAMVTAGPGGTNAITGVAGAWLDSMPCFFLSGQCKSADLMWGPQWEKLGLRQLGVQEVDIVALVKPITKYAVTIVDPTSIRYEMEKAKYLALEGRPGPVWIDFPLDIQGATIDENALVGFTPPPQSTNNSLKDDVSGAIALLNESERPVLVAGNGIRVAGAEKEFVAFAEAVGAPVLLSWLGLDLIPHSHELCIGRPGSMAPRGPNFALQNSDLMLAIGTRLDMAMTGYSHPNLARAARKIMVDIDAAEIGKMQTKIDLPVVADAGQFMRELVRQKDSIIRKDREPWMSRCRKWKTQYPVVQPEHRKQSGLPSLYHFAEVLSGELQDNEVIACGSSGFASEIFLLVIEPKPGQRIFHTRGLGAMGFGIPAAIGAAFASGASRVITVDGDGGFQMNIQELETIRRHGLPIKFFVINNEGYASIRSSQTGYFKLRVGCDATSGMTLPDLARLGVAYDIPTVLIDSPEGMRDKICEVLNMSGPVICEVRVLPDEARVPRLSSERRPDGSMVSKPLEDLFPFLDREEFRANMLIPPVEG